MESKERSFINPIDPDKVANTPGLLEYAHHVASAIIKPEDTGKIKGRAVSAMYQQTQMQLDQIKDQIELLAKQAGVIKDRLIISEKIYNAKISFEPLIGHTYYLYETDNGQWILSLIAPDEWRRKNAYHYLATLNLLSDHTWQIIHQSKTLVIDEK